MRADNPRTWKLLSAKIRKVRRTDLKYRTAENFILMMGKLVVDGLIEIGPCWS